jgi:hypothetical protein
MSLVNRHSYVLLASIFCGLLMLYFLSAVESDSHVHDNDDESGEVGIDYEWIGVYTDADGLEREVPVVQRKDGVILLTTFNFYSVVNLDIYSQAFILWTVDNSDLCDEAEQALSVAARHLSPDHLGSSPSSAGSGKRALYAQFRVDKTDEDHLQLLKSKGLGSNDFPTLSVLYARTKDKRQAVEGFSGPLTEDALSSWAPSTKHSEKLSTSVGNSTLMFQDGLLVL